VLHPFLADQNEATFNALWGHCAFDIDRLRSRMGGLWDAYAGYTLERARLPQMQAAQRALLEQFGFAPVSPEELSRITVPTALI
jgi:hypothetical protein